MLTPAEYHKKLLVESPTPAQLKLYEAYPEKHGFAEYLMDAELIEATLILAMFLTYNQVEKKYRSVLFATLSSYETPITGVLKDTLSKLKKISDSIPDPKKAKAYRQQVLTSVRNISMGSRVYALSLNPTYWVAYGFGKDSMAPQWLLEGLL